MGIDWLLGPPMHLFQTMLGGLVAAVLLDNLVASQRCNQVNPQLGGLVCLLALGLPLSLAKHLLIQLRHQLLELSDSLA